MTFVLLMAGREIRASWRRLLFFFVCVAIGVGAIVALRSMIQNIRNGLSREARALIAGDVVIGTNRSWTPELRAAIDRRLASAPIVGRQDAVEVASMVRPAEGQGTAAAKMVELRGVQPGFPFYGTIVLEGGAPFSHDLLANHGALVRPELLAQLGLQRGRSPDRRRCSLHDSRRDFAGAGAARRARSASDRACSSTTTI